MITSHPPKLFVLIKPLSSPFTSHHRTKTLPKILTEPKRFCVWFCYCPHQNLGALSLTRPDIGEWELPALHRSYRLIIYTREMCFFFITATAALLGSDLDTSRLKPNPFFSSLRVLGQVFILCCHKAKSKSI